MIHKLVDSFFRTAERSMARRRRLGRICWQADVLEQRQMLVATNILDVPDVAISSSGTSAGINLGDHFDDPDVTGSTVRIDSALGSFIIETYDDITPVTAQNFVDLAAAGNYDDMFIHRSDPTDPLSIIQGGGFRWPEGPNVASVENNGTIVNEFDRWFDPNVGGLQAGTPLNTRGTISMAKVAGNPDSATSQWFVNLSDNAEILDPQNGGFTVFGRVLFDGMTTVDAIAALEVVNAGTVFAELPVIGNPVNEIERVNVVLTTSTVVSELTYEITGNTNPAVVTPTIVDGQLQLATSQGVTGTSFVTITVTDLQGNVLTETVEVAVEVPVSSRVTGPGSGVDVRPEFSWTASSQATHYELWVNRKGGPNAIIRERALTGTSFTPSDDMPTGDYVAWIRAFNDQGSAVWSEASEFSIGLQSVEITSPGAVTEDNTPTFEWSASPGATEYDVWVNQVGGQSQVIRARVSGTTFTPTESLVDGEYRVWVQAEDGSVQSAWSPGVTFEVSSTGRLVAPVGVQNTARPEIRWQGPDGTWELWVNEIGGQARVIHETALSGFTHTPDFDLANGQYRGWVRLRNAGVAPGTWSEAFDFFVEQSTVPGGAEILDVSTGTQSPTFTWGAVENAVRFELWVNQVGGTPRVIHLTDITTLNHTTAEVLAQGDYRAWLRGFSAGDTAGPWSPVFAFTI